MTVSENDSKKRSQVGNGIGRYAREKPRFDSDPTLRERRRAYQYAWHKAMRIRKRREGDIWFRLVTALALAKRRAGRKGMPFDLTMEWAVGAWTGLCAVSSLPLAVSSVNQWNSPSIDRVNSAIGYLQDNCRFVALAVNHLKGEDDDATMLRVAVAIVKTANERHNEQAGTSTA